MKNKFLRKITISLFIAITFCMLTMNKSNAMNLNKMFNYDILNKIKETLANVNNIDVDITKSTIKSSTNDSNGIQTSSIEEDKIFYIGDSWMEDLREYELSESPRSYFFAENSRNADWVLDNYYDVDIPDDASCIVVEFGLNDYTNWDETQELAEKLASDYSNKEIYILRTPHVCSGYSYPSNFNSQVDIYNEHMKNFCEGKERITFIDPTVTIVEDNGNGYLKDEYAADPYDTDLGGGKMHLSVEGYGVWYEDIIKGINNAILENNKLVEIKITQAPSKTEYIEEEDFSPIGMKVEAIFSNGLSTEITNYTISDGNELTLGQKSVTISYTEKDITKNTTQPIAVSAKEVSSIKVTKSPNKTSYIEGENFAEEGMTLLVTYNNGKTKLITEGYSILDGENLKEDQTKVTISYTENETTQTTTVDISVSEKEEDLQVNFKEYEIEEEGNRIYLKKILPETTVETFKSNITTNGDIEIYKESDKVTDKELITTGMEVTIRRKNKEEKYVAVVMGDLMGNGKIDNLSLLKLARYEAKIDLNLEGEYLKAANLYEDKNSGDIKDLLKMARVLAKLEEI